MNGSTDGRIATPWNTTQQRKRIADKHNSLDESSGNYAGGGAGTTTTTPKGYVLQSPISEMSKWRTD